MTVCCPRCSTRYALPDHLMGPRGARIRCPHCRETFVVSREAAGESPEPAIAAAASTPLAADVAPSVPAAAAAAPPPAPEAVAAALLDDLGARLGDRLEAAVQQGRVLSELGPELLAAWDEFRRRLGPDARPEAFRQVLRERWSVDLGPGLPESHGGRG